MRNISAIMMRELLSLFCSPIGYVVIAGFLLTTGVLVWATDSFAPGKPANLRGVFQYTPFLLTIIIPAISMRTLSEEYRSGTIETLMTAPVSDTQLVLGKFLAALVFYVVMLAGTVIYLVLMEIFGTPEWGASFAAYFGLLLMGSAFLAFGVFTSSLSRNQIVAWMAGAIPLLLFIVMAYFLVGKTEGWLRRVLQRLNIMERFQEFTRGLVGTDSVVFFLGMTALWLFLTVKVVESRRWR